MSGARPPVIIVGMHRSGTSLLTRVLQRFGFFMGRGTTRNEEAAFTNAINAWVFHHAGATWDQPTPMDQLLVDADLQPWMEDYLGRVINGPAACRFLGLGRWLRWRGLHRIAEPWGWKDPRNTFTLPIWLRLFPNARVLHIVRHGVDVAASLQARRARELEANLERYQRWRRAYCANPLAPKRRPFAGHVRCGQLEGGFSLWEAYVDRAREHCAMLGAQAMEIRYEDLLSEPTTVFDRALEFCGLEATPSQIREAGAQMKAGRALAFTGRPEQVEFGEIVAPRLRARGYK